MQAKDLVKPSGYFSTVNIVLLKINDLKMRYIRTFFFSILISSCTAQDRKPDLKTEESGNTLLWEVSGNGLQSPSYLFGTFHMLCRDDIRFSPSLKEAFASSRELYLELDMDDPPTVLGGLMLMNMKKGTRLQDLYTPEEYTRVERFFKDSLKTPLTMFQTMKPFFLVAMLYPKMMPCKTISGVEEELMKLAKDQKKEVQGLETMAFQASIFDSIPYEQQAKELLKTVDSLDHFRKYFDTMLVVYKSQRIREMADLFNDNEMGVEENQDILLDNRNRNWVTQLKKIMQKEPVFVAVGAGHLPGDKGLINLLKKEGYTVRPVKND